MQRVRQERFEGDLRGIYRCLKPGCCKVSHEHKVTQDTQPFALYPYRILDKLKQGVQQEIQALLDQRIIEESN